MQLHSITFLISPQALTLAYLGSDGETESELMDVLGFKDSQTGEPLERADVIKNYLFEREFQVKTQFKLRTIYFLTNVLSFSFSFLV